ncbi:hypothetical protein E4U57_000732 [Claviceps arundinis]|uniref:Uncharacterized protein n=1 Tax=Claviceps arundinis TaxID=1623583 RepID=A0A9P7N1C3_9HYPO|nr:hypothetical protein E4U57_000732 [Claviceps arundinis]KAG5977330.1 hypothetical protein E4U56_008156 [Claviceps arundinis]
MSEGIDKSLLDRLQALRGAGSSPEKAESPKNNAIKVDVIERARTPTGGDLLAARLKSLREQAHSPRSSKSTPCKSETTKLTAPSPRINSIARSSGPNDVDREHEDDEDALLETSDQALEEMLAEDLDLSPIAPTRPAHENKNEAEVQDEQAIKALLEQLSASVPTDTHSDDSDGETMTRETNTLIAQYKDEVDLVGNTTPPPPADTILDLPSAPETETSTSSTLISDLTARMAALRHSADTPELLPSVPTSQPSKPVNRLTSKTRYTDDDMDSWCTVCLEDATLQCTGCDGDVYCTRCWREMHLGPAAHFDDVDHKAVQFTRHRDKMEEEKVALET